MSASTLRGRSTLSVLERLAHVLSARLALALIIGRVGVAAAEPPATAAEDAVALDRVLEVAGLRLHLHCEGHGSPTVVFESGTGSDGSVWRSVQPGVARVTRACAYDRAGLGYSGPGRKPRTSDRMAAELHALLAAAHVTPPYVLVGHSAGGLNARLFASEHPGEVVGMVLVDATTAGGERLWSLMSEDESRQLRDRMRRGPDGWDHDSFVESMRRVGEAPALGDLPLVVLTRGRDDPPAPGVSPEEAARRFAIWQELQADAARLSTQSRHVVVPEARHFIQWDAPVTVIDAVRDVVLAARSGRRLEGAARVEPPGDPAASARSAAGSAGTPATLSIDGAPPSAPEPLPATVIASAPSSTALPPAAANARFLTPGNATRASAPTLWQRFQQGGLTMFALLGLSVLALATTLERGLGFREKGVLDGALFEQADALWSAGRFAELEELCRRSGSVAARVVHAVVRHRARPYADVSAVAGEIASGALREHVRRTTWLSVVATLSPLLGLFGTVVGMVEAFDAIAASGVMGDPALVATGISKALVTTAAGLLVGIPALGARHFFLTRIHRIAAQLESQTNDLVRRWLLTERAQP